MNSAANTVALKATIQSRSRSIATAAMTRQQPPPLGESRFLYAQKAESARDDRNASDPSPHRVDVPPNLGGGKTGTNRHGRIFPMWPGESGTIHDDHTGIASE